MIALIVKTIVVFPTQVGVILILTNGLAMMKSVPHTGGGDPIFQQVQDAVLMCSPHRWG